MRYFSALWARMYLLRANSRATTSSTAIFLSQQSRQYFSSPRGSETSFAPQSAQRDFATALRDISRSILAPTEVVSLKSAVGSQSSVESRQSAVGSRQSRVGQSGPPRRATDWRLSTCD